MPWPPTGARGPTGHGWIPCVFPHGCEAQTRARWPVYFSSTSLPVQVRLRCTGFFLHLCISRAVGLRKAPSGVCDAEAQLGVVSHGTGKCPSPVFPRVHPDPNTSAVRSTGYCSGMIMRLRGSVCTRGVLQMLATSHAMYPAWFLRGRGWRTSSAPLPQWKRHPMPGGGAPVVRELPSWTVNNGEGLMVRGGGRTCSPG